MTTKQESTPLRRKTIMTIYFYVLVLWCNISCSCMEEDIANKDEVPQIKGSPERQDDHQ